MIVSNGALIETKAEENEERALEALEAAVADLASTMKDLRRATDRFGARMSTAVSKTEQISSSMMELRNSLHCLEQTTNRLVNSSLPVAPSTMASHHRHVPLPVIPSITGSVPPSSSIPPPSSFSTFANSSVMSKLPFDTGVLRASITEPLPTLTRTEKPPSPEFPAFQFEELPPPLLLKSRPQTPFHAVPNMLPSLSANSSLFPTPPSSKTHILPRIPHTSTDPNSAKPPFTPILQNCLTPHSPSPELPTPNSNTALMAPHRTHGLCSNGDTLHQTFHGSPQNLIPYTETTTSDNEIPTDPFSKPVHQHIFGKFVSIIWLGVPRTISLHAWDGRLSPSTLRLQGISYGHSVVVSVDGPDEGCAPPTVDIRGTVLELLWKQMTIQHDGTDKPPSLEFSDSQFDVPPTTTFQRTFTKISTSLSRVEKQFNEPPWLPNFAPFFSPSMESSDFPIDKPQTVTNRPIDFTSLKKLNSTDLDWEEEGGSVDAKFGRTKNFQPPFVARWPLTLVAEHYRLSGWGYQCVPVVYNSNMDAYEVRHFSLTTIQGSPTPMVLNRGHDEIEQFHFNQPFGNTMLNHRHRFLQHFKTCQQRDGCCDSAWGGLFESITSQGFDDSMELWGRVGRGIHPKLLILIHANFIGRVKRKSPKDHPRHSVVIANKVGDAVGGIVGTESDLFGSVAAFNERGVSLMSPELDLNASVCVGEILLFFPVDTIPVDGKGLTRRSAVAKCMLIGSNVVVFSAATLDLWQPSTSPDGSSVSDGNCGSSAVEDQARIWTTHMMLVSTICVFHSLHPTPVPLEYGVSVPTYTLEGVIVIAEGRQLACSAPMHAHVRVLAERDASPTFLNAGALSSTLRSFPLLSVSVFAAWVLAGTPCTYALGLYNIPHWNQHISEALTPYYMYDFLKQTRLNGRMSRGEVLLCIIGLEAMFLALRHFSYATTQIAGPEMVEHRGKILLEDVGIDETAELVPAALCFLGLLLPVLLHHVHGFRVFLLEYYFISVLGDRFTEFIPSACNFISGLAYHIKGWSDGNLEAIWKVVVEAGPDPLYFNLEDKVVLMGTAMLRTRRYIL